MPSVLVIRASPFTHIDLEKKRTVSDAQQRLCEDLKWAGLEWDEGPEKGGPHAPYNQSQRTKLYVKAAEALIDTKHAYRCFCSASEELPSSIDDVETGSRIGGCQHQCHDLSEADVKERIDSKSPFVVRFNNTGPAPVWKDYVYGTMKPSKGGKAENINGSVLIKSDGHPTYHLANVVDDHAMDITHVVRGTEWMSSTALHVALYDALGWQCPEFVHVGLLTDKDGAKLSKRNLDIDVRSVVKKNGLFPEALINFLVLMGWSHRQKTDVLAMDDLIKLFNLKLTRGNSVVDFGKLWFLQTRHFRRRRALAIDNDDNNHLMDLPLEYLQQASAVANMGAPMRDIIGPRSLRAYLRSILFAAGPAAEWPSTTEFVALTDMFYNNGPLHKTIHTEQPQVESIVRSFIHHPAVAAALSSTWANVPDTETMSAIARVFEPARQACSDVLSELCQKSLEVASGHVSSISPGGSEAHKTNVAGYRTLQTACHNFLRLALALRDGAAPTTFNMMIVLGLDESRRRIQAVLPPA